jgi:hypothetical protein
MKNEAQARYILSTVAAHWQVCASALASMCKHICTHNTFAVFANVLLAFAAHSQAHLQAQYIRKHLLQENCFTEAVDGRALQAEVGFLASKMQGLLQRVVDGVHLLQAFLYKH